MEYAVDPLLTAADRVLGDSYSAVLYGSLARGDYSPASSDVNLLLVLDSVDPAILRALSPAFLEWRAHSPEPPLLMSRAEWDRATDVFPIEIVDMQAARRVLRGADPVAHLTVDPTDLRRALESDFRGKLLRLRQGYTLFANRPVELGKLALSSAPTALVLFRCLLTLLGRTPATPVDGEAVIAAAARAADFSPEGPLEVVRRRGATGWRCPPETFEAYLGAIVRAAQYVDQLPPGDAS